MRQKVYCLQYSQCQTGEQTGFYRCRRHVSGCRFTKVLSLADLRLPTLSLDKLHGNVTIFRLLSTTHTHTGRQRTYADTARRFYGRAWKACSCCMIVNHGRVAAALGCLVVCQCVCVCNLLHDLLSCVVAHAANSRSDSDGRGGNLWQSTLRMRNL